MLYNKQTVQQIESLSNPHEVLRHKSVSNRRL